MEESCSIRDPGDCRQQPMVSALFLCVLMVCGFLPGGAQAQNFSFHSQLLAPTTGGGFGEQLLCLDSSSFPSSFVIAAPYMGMDEGRVFVTEQLGEVTTATLVPPVSGLPDNFGSALEEVADADGDTFTDIAIGTPGDSSAYIFSRDGSEILHLTGEPGDSFGTSLASLGVQSFGSDTFPVLAVGAPYRGSGDGAVDVMRADSSGGLLFSILPPTSGGLANFGRLVESVGDLDGDGMGELAISAPNRLDPSSGDVIGEVSFHRGALAGAGTRIISLMGTKAGYAFGSSIGSVPDIDGDGIDEVFIGSPSLSSGQSGYMEIFSGAALGDGFGVPLCRWEPLSEMDASFGSDFVSLGDTDGDSVSEILVSSPYYEDPSAPGLSRGRIYVIELNNGNCFSSRDLPLPSGFPMNLQAGVSFAAGSQCDFNEDGISDLAIGTGEDGSGLFSGSVLLYLGEEPESTTNPQISALQYRISRDGTLAGKNSYDEAPLASDNCSIELLAKMGVGETLRELQSISQQAIAEVDFRFSASNLPKVSKIDGVRPIVHMATRSVCSEEPETELRSNISSRFLSCGIGDFGVTPAQWMQSFRDSFSLDPALRERNEVRKRKYARAYRKFRRDYLNRNDVRE